ncbi:hypothetical protein NXS15_01300 [Mycoplasma sp. CSL7475-4]|uniref:hypothetical protein n=1 Tax=Mycoplasma sp. CSL7475-4 TaxID=2973942 RepID=UPI00216AC71F|nr:hypothetical protein [Mycoplasma sp. CSL7475-4]MCS4536767.1 hypothetical protein [Mycoplasma sp. CSL7475-4]
MLSVDLSPYDFIIATPPCNYYSRANYRRETSEYAQRTKHLLLEILAKLRAQDKPYIVENVINKKLMREFLHHSGEYLYFVGRHTYWTNIKLDQFKQEKEPLIQSIASKNRQGGRNVFLIVEEFLDKIHRRN